MSRRISSGWYSADRGLNAANRFLTVGGGLCALVMTLLVTFEVVMRYVLRSPTNWTVEVSQFLLLGVIFLAAGYTLQVDGHIKIEVLVTRLPQKVRFPLSVVTHILGLVFVSVLTWKTGQLTWLAYQGQWLSWGNVPIRIFLIYMVMPLGGLLLCLKYLMLLYQLYQSRGSVKGE